MAKMFARCRPTVFWLMNNASAVCLLLAPAAVNASTSASRSVRPPGSAAAVEPADIRQGTEFAVDRQCGRGIRGGNAGLSQPAVRLGEQFVGSGGVVAGMESSVLVDDGLQHGQRLGVLRLRDQHGGPGLSGPGAEAGGAELGGGFLQPGAEPLGLIKVPESQGDFDAGHQQPCACQPVPPGQGGAQAGPCRLVLPGGMLEQGLARLRFGPQLPCPGVGFLSAAAVPAEPA